MKFIESTKKVKHKNQQLFSNENKTLKVGKREKSKNKRTIAKQSCNKNQTSNKLYEHAVLIESLDHWMDISSFSMRSQIWSSFNLSLCLSRCLGLLPLFLIWFYTSLWFSFQRTHRKFSKCCDGCLHEPNFRSCCCC